MEIQEKIALVERDGQNFKNWNWLPLEALPTCTISPQFISSSQRIIQMKVQGLYKRKVIARSLSPLPKSAWQQIQIYFPQYKVNVQRLYPMQSKGDTLTFLILPHNIELKVSEKCIINRLFSSVNN